MRAAILALALVLTLAGYASFAFSQTTSGTSATIVVPVIAQTVSFGSEVTVYNPNAVTITLHPTFYDAQNTSSPGLKSCTSLVVGTGVSTQFTVATQCALPGGSNFGLLVLAEATGTQRFYGYARTQTPQGVGFSTEGFPIENFNDQLQHATGLKRVAAAAGLPAFQTNCFVATLGDAVSYELRLFNGATNTQLGGTLSGSLGAFQQFRYLDVFAAAGVPAGNKTNVRAQFTNLTGAHKKLIGFCTVQDNTSFSADFRIAKSYGGTPQNAFVQGGNAFGTAALAGTVDNQPLTVLTNNQPVMRYLPNTTSPNLIGGHPNNSVGAFYGQTIAGGGKALTGCFDPPTGTSTRSCGNQTNAEWATVGGGLANIASGGESTIGGGSSNTANGNSATVAGGAGNTASSGSATVGGGLSNVASSAQATVSGGHGNTASSEDATIGGGEGNLASGPWATIGGGELNIASGSWATVPGGFGNQALGTASFAAGENAVVTHNVSFLWCDGQACASQEDHDFIVVASGGIKLYTASGLGGCLLTNPAGSGWVCTSDRNLKENFVALDSVEVLRRLLAMPITRWNVKADPGRVPHIGPVAQDFYAAFGLGTDDLHIASGDESGVALAAIQGLNAKLEERVAEQQREIADLRERISAAESLRSELAAVKAALIEIRRSREITAAR